MKVLVLGGAGYIGSMLCTYLEENGDSVTVMDNFLYEENPKPFLPANYIKGDVRNINDLWAQINKVDAVVNLAALSNDPASDLDPQLTWDVNYRANEHIAELCRIMGKRVIFASSCSVYGFAETGVFNENSQLGPVTLYARTKMLSEKYYEHPDLEAVMLRFATVYGHAPKPRFDLVVNTMIGHGFFEKKIQVNGGDQWRPLVHVKDVAEAIRLVLHKTDLKHRVYNVGSNDQNYQIKDLGRMIAADMPGVALAIQDDNIDKRSYKVDFSRIMNEGFKVKYGITDAVTELNEAFNKKQITTLADNVYYRVKYLKTHPFPNYQSNSNRVGSRLRFIKLG